MRKPRPDNRPRWNDPDLPVFSIWRQGARNQPVPADEAGKVFRWMIEHKEAPNWRDDPSYDWAARSRLTREE
jgi:hypothetical protein